MDKTILITRPRHDLTTKYFYYWSKKLLELAKEKNIKVLDLADEKANKKELISRVTKMAPSFIMINGHGNASIVTGHDNQELVKVGEESILKNSIVYARACKSAQRLGPSSVKLGCLAYIGYIEDFIFICNLKNSSRPLEDKTAALFLEPSNQVVVSLLKGHTPKEASQRSKDFSKRNIYKLLSSEAPEGDSQYVRFIFWNMKNQTCLD